MHAEEQALGALRLVAEERHQAGIAAEVRDVLSTLVARRFNVAVIGQFKRGKSTLINALIGRELLPADVAPITSAITIVEHGAGDRAFVRFSDGRQETIRCDELRLFVSEEENPANRKGVRAARLEVPSPLLETGVRLVDTPGVGSVFAANSEVTRAFVPRLDVAIVVLGSDPPITGEELALVRTAAPDVARLLFVLNKADLVPAATRVKAEAFSRRVLGEALGGGPDWLVHASALGALNDGRDEGVDALRHELFELARGSGSELALASAGRALRDIAARLAQQLDLEQTALTAPLADLDRRISAFRGAMRDVDDLAIAALERARTGRSYDAQKWHTQRAEFLDRARRQIRSAIEGELESAARLGRPRLRAAARDIALAATRSLVVEWYQHARVEFARLREGWLAGASEEANRLIGRVAAAAASAFGTPVARFEPPALEIETSPGAFEFSEPVLFLDPAAIAVPVADAILPLHAVARRAAARAARLAGDWLEHNLNETDQRLTGWVDALSRCLDAAIKSRLDAVRQEVLDAVAAGRQSRIAGESAIQQKLSELQRQRDAVARAAALAPRRE